MADLLVDSDIFIDHLRGAKELRPGRNRLSYSVVTRSELLAGTSASDQVLTLLAPFTPINVDAEIADRAGRIRRETRTRLPDALIAATAVLRTAGLVTRNDRDFSAVRGLRLRHLA